MERRIDGKGTWGEELVEGEKLIEAKVEEREKGEEGGGEGQQHLHHHLVPVAPVDGC